MNVKLSLKQAWSLIIIVVMLVPAVLGAVWYGYTEYGRQINATLAIEEISNQALSIEVDAEVERLLSVLKNKADPLSILVDEVGKIEASAEMYRLLRRVMTREPAIRELMVISADSTVVAAIDLELGVVGDPLEAHNSLKAVAEHWGFDLNNDIPEIAVPLLGRDYIGSPKKHDEYIAFSMSVPIGNVNHGVLIAIIDVAKIWSVYHRLNNMVGVGNSSNYLLDRRGLLMSNVEGTDWEITDLMTHMSIIRSALVGEDWLQSQSYIGVMGETVYGTYTTVPSIGWVLVSEVNASKIREPVLNVIYQTTTGVFFLILIFIWLAMRLAARTIKPIDDISIAINQFAEGDNVCTVKLSGIKELDGMTADLTRMIERQEEAVQQLRLSDRVFKESHEGVMITDADEKIIDVNPALCEISGYKFDELVGQKPSILNSGKYDQNFYAEMWKEINSVGYWHGEVWNRKKDGELYTELLTIFTLLDDDGAVRNYVGMSTDITNLKQQQQTLELMAHYDVLTQLPNRILFTDRFSQAVAHSSRTNTSVAVCFIDLDEFKPVNDKYGHAVGDQLLVEVADRLKASIREEDTVSRQGGDEFTLLLGAIQSEEECERMLKRIHQSLAKPYNIDGEIIVISASSGATIYPADDADLDTLVRHADQAMYEAKQYGRNRYQLFNAEKDKAIFERLDRLDEIRQALNKGEFCLYFQPKVNMATGDVYGAEALIRWLHPEKGLIPPLDFLPFIDGNDLEVEVGNWVIEQALQRLEQWSEQGLGLEISVNIASYHLVSPTFVSHLGEALKRYATVEPRHLQLEILESSALSSLTVISEIIKICRETLGVSVALDDFGTGYSSLTHLRNLPANVIKIDQSFVRDMLDDPNDSAIIDGVLGLADAFSREVIAEGVETTEHGLMLLSMGCDKAQGYGIARPMPMNDFLVWFKQYVPNEAWLVSANEQKNVNDYKIEQFYLVVERWKNKFGDAVNANQGNVSHWPIMDKSHCHCHHWINRVWKEQLFDEEWMMMLENSHEEFHAEANKIMENYNDGNVDDAQQGLAGFQLFYEQLINVALGVTVSESN